MLFKDVLKVSDFEEFLREKKRLSENSIYTYRYCVEQFLAGNPNLNDVEDYNSFLINHSIKKRSRHFYSILKTFLEFNFSEPNSDKIAKANILDNLIRAPEQPRMKKERKYLEQDEIIKLINCMRHDKHKIISLIQDCTGIRAGDVLRIRRGDIIPETYKGENVLRIIITGKGNKRNVIYIHEELVQKLIMIYIVRNFTNEEFYFINEERWYKGKPKPTTRYRINYNNYLIDLKKALDECGFDKDSFATHDYRRCYARRVWTKYKDLYVLQELLNHTDPKTTMRYLKGSGLKNIDYHKEMQS